MEKFIQLGEKFGLEGEKLLEFVREQEVKEDKRREEEREEKRREEEREEKRRQLQEEEDREERRRRQDEEREARRQEREIRKLQQEADLMRQKEAAEVAKREHELELARIAAMNGDARTAERGDREDRAKAPKLPSFVDGKDDLDTSVIVVTRIPVTLSFPQTTKLICSAEQRAADVRGGGTLVEALRTSGWEAKQGHTKEAFVNIGRQEMLFQVSMVLHRLV
ncbi:uncharacterized protein [Montipora foliosa]|uniref:uncharacterized protein n=1 Tax=Montipora foliosa TaxID=591990 RepID=UPI0035F1B36E